MRAADLIKLSSVRRRLVKSGVGTSARALRKLTAMLAERGRKMRVLERLGLGKHVPENLYPPPDFERDKK